MRKPERTLEYRRARFSSDSQNLELLTRKAWKEFDNQAERTFSVDGGYDICGMSFYDLGTKGFGIHCGMYTKGQRVGTILTEPKKMHVEIHEHSLNSNENFLTSSFVAFIRKNHVICLNCGANGKNLYDYLMNLISGKNILDVSHYFELIQIGRYKEIEMIKKHKVKYLELGVGISEASKSKLDEVKSENKWEAFSSGAWEVLKSVIAKQKNFSQIQRAKGATVKMSISVPDGNIEGNQDGLSGFATDLVEDEEADQFVIRLGNGSIIKPSGIAVKKRVKLAQKVNWPNVREAWKAMSEYMDELNAAGHLQG